MGRPKGSSDKKVRKRKSFWTMAQLDYLSKNYHHTPNKLLSKQLDKSQENMMRKARELGLVKHYFLKSSGKIEDITGCGVYGIYNKVVRRIYIGSSVNITKRLRVNYLALEDNTHYNSQLQEDWVCCKTDFLYVLLYLCSEDELLHCEHKLIEGWGNSYNRKSIKEARSINPKLGNGLRLENRREEIVQSYLKNGNVMVVAREMDADYQQVYNVIRTEGCYVRKWGKVVTR